MMVQLQTIYHKPIANFSTIPYSAPVPIDYNLANFRYLIYRASILCSSSDELNTEFKFIKDLALNDSFPSENDCKINKL